jgi:hypothetical protein
MTATRQKLLERVETALQALLGARLNKPSMKAEDWDKLRLRLEHCKRTLFDVMKRS